MYITALLALIITSCRDGHEARRVEVAHTRVERGTMFGVSQRGE